MKIFFEAFYILITCESCTFIQWGGMLFYDGFVSSETQENEVKHRLHGKVVVEMEVNGNAKSFFHFLSRCKK